MRGTRCLYQRNDVGTLLGFDRLRPRHAFRGMLLPRHRILHRARHCTLRGRRTGNAQACARTFAGHDAFAARDRRSRLCGRDCRLLRARAHRRGARGGRTGRIESVSRCDEVMLIYSASHFVLPLPATHRFPMRKYALLHERIAARAPEFLRIPAAVENAELANAHSTDYIAAVAGGMLAPSSLRQIGFPWSPTMVERSRRSAGATLGACREALASGCGINLAGGTHHAHRDHGAGFCVFNDAAVAIRTLQAEGRIERALVIDLDVHQGDGTAAIFAGDPPVFTFSMHGRGNFPFVKAASSLDIELADGTEDGEYLTILSLALAQVLSGPKTDLVIYL